MAKLKLPKLRYSKNHKTAGNQLHREVRRTERLASKAQKLMDPKKKQGSWTHLMRKVSQGPGYGGIWDSERRRLGLRHKLPTALQVRQIHVQMDKARAIYKEAVEHDTGIKVRFRGRKFFD